MRLAISEVLKCTEICLVVPNVFTEEETGIRECGQA